MTMMTHSPLEIIIKLLIIEWKRFRTEKCHCCNVIACVGARVFGNDANNETNFISPIFSAESCELNLSIIRFEVKDQQFPPKSHRKNGKWNRRCHHTQRIGLIHREMVSNELAENGEKINKIFRVRQTESSYDTQCDAEYRLYDLYTNITHTRFTLGWPMPRFRCLNFVRNGESLAKPKQMMISGN